MDRGVYRFDFNPAVSLVEAELTLHLALIAVEGLHGEAKVRMDASLHVDAPRRAIFVDGTTDVGDSLVRVLTRFLSAEFGEGAFRIRRVLAIVAERRSPGEPLCAAS